MWILTIYQMKQYSSFESEQEVSFESEDVNYLLIMVSKAAASNINEKTRYEIKEVNATTEGEEE